MSELRNKVITALSKCIERKYASFPDGCTDCEYFLKDPDCMIALMMDALTCIVSVEETVLPHVMDLPELRDLPVGAVVWRETCWPTEEDNIFNFRLDHVMREKSDPLYFCADMLVAWDGYENLDDPELLKAAEDGGQIRFWSSKPTDEQRRDEPWTP